MQEQKYSIKQGAKDAQPREKLREEGATALSNSERTAILISNEAAIKSCRTGSGGFGAGEEQSAPNWAVTL
jgi:hypothetical protein